MKNLYITQLDPRHKLILLVLYNILVFSLSRFLSLGLLLFSLILLWKIEGIHFPSIKSYARFFIPLFLFLLLIQILFVPGERYFLIIGPIQLVTIEGLKTGLQLGLRLLVLTMLMPTLFLTTPLNHLILGLTGLGLPYKSAYLMTTALNVIPLLRDDFKAIVTSQKLRGFAVFEKGKIWEKMKAYPVLMVPLVVGAARRAQTMGVSMEARAYGITKERTYRHKLRAVSRDWVISILLCLYALLLLFLDWHMTGSL
jgi:energy-coupling factor transport system permease protein